MIKRFKPLLLVSMCLMFIFNSSFIYGEQNADLDQTVRLGALAKVWGLLKYYHPEIAKGEIDWDAALINAIPAVIAAQDYDSFNQEINNLILVAGDISNDYNAGVPAHPNEELFKWLKDSELFNNVIRKKLQTVQKKHVPADNYYVQAFANVGNTSYANEKRYDDSYYPDQNYRLLAVFRYWNIIQYFFPYKADMDQDWENVLEEFIPKMIAAADMFEYGFVIKAMTVKINDSHALTGGGTITYQFGYFMAPLEVRHIEGKTIVTNVADSLMEPAGAIREGDIIVKTHGKDIDEFRDDMYHLTHGSNEPTIQRNINTLVIRGRSNQLSFTIQRNGQTQDVTVASYYTNTVYNAFDAEPIQKWKILPGNIGYVHMGVALREDVDGIMAELMNTKAIIFDIRNYPNSTLYLFSAYLNPEPTEFVKFTYPDLDYPGDLAWMYTLTSTWENNPDYYTGRVVVLLDERTQSQAEFTCMALQTTPDTTLIGSQTAGADGNVSYVWLPGFVYTYFTGLGVYYPDGTATQRIGIVPDIHIRPTVAGIIAGRDEVLERALSFIRDNK